MRKNNAKLISNCLRKYRRARGLTQKDVARVLRLHSTSLISRWEKGICLPNTINAFRLAVVYRTMADALFIDLVRQLKGEIRKSEANVFKSRI